MAAPNESSLFHHRPEFYDTLVNWPKRLARETPLYRNLFASVDAKSVLDVACGTGRHAALFREWGLTVIGMDLSQAMLDYCRDQHGESATLRWLCQSYDEPAKGIAPQDVVMCMGNSLALAGAVERAQQAVRAMMSSVRPGGACYFQVLNAWAKPEGPIRWQRQQRVTLNDELCLMFKGFHRQGDQTYVETLYVREGSDPLAVETHSSKLLAFEADDLEKPLREAGATHIERFGNVDREPYNREQSQDLIVIGYKA